MSNQNKNFSPSHPLTFSSSVTPKVSVIMNCLNCSKYLEEAIDSVYAQTYKDWEIILWDNASTDSSAKIAKDYDEKLRYFKSKETVPLGKARNWAIEKARGEYIAILDCDDVWLPTKLEKQIPLFKEGVVLVYSNSYVLDEINKKKFVLLKRSLLQRGSVLDKLCENNFIPCLSAVISKKSLEKLGQFFDPIMEMAEEYELFLRLAMIGKIDFVDELLVIARFHRESTMRRKYYLFPHDYSYILMKHKENISHNNLKKIANQYLYYVANDLGNMNRRFYGILFFTFSFKLMIKGLFKLLLPSQGLELIKWLKEVLIDHRRRKHFEEVQ